jgi:hypothetical protein
MKIITKPKQREEAEIFSDFSGERFAHDIPEVTLKFEFNYGSKFDDSQIEFHFSDLESKDILELIKIKLSEKTKQLIKGGLKKTEESYNQSFDCRDWDGCDYYAANADLYKYFLDHNDTRD